MLQMGAVTVTPAATNATGFGLDGTLTTSKLDYNAAAAEYKRLSWARAFGTRMATAWGGAGGVLNPGGAGR